MMEEAGKQEELDQMACWLREEGVASDAPVKDQLCILWRSLQHRESRLVTVTHDLDTLRSRHSGEMTEVQRSLEQIRTLTEEKDVLAQEIQQENDQLRVQLHRLMLHQDAQINEVAEMLYQEGLAEVIHSNPSEQVAYLLAERASLLERNEGPDGPMSHGDTPFTSQLEAEAQHQRLKENSDQAESRQLSGQAFSVERECARLERDLEEGSRRLAMAHKEIRRLTDELESARLTQSAYEPELQGAQQEVEQLRQQVEKLKKRDVVELRKAKELNDRLDQEIRALRTRVRALDAERRSLQETVVSFEREVGRLGTDLHNQQQQATQQLLTVQAQDDQTSELAEAQAAELAQSRQTCRRLQEELMAQTERRKATETAVHNLQQQLENSDKDMGNLSASVCTKDNDFQRERRLWEQSEADLQQEVSSLRRLEASLARRDEECKQLALDVQRTQSLLSAAEQQVTLLTEDKLSLQRDVTRLQLDNANIQAELEEEQQRSRELKERLSQSSQDAHNNNNNNRLRDQLNAKRTQLVTMETEIQALRQQLKASEQQFHQERSCSVESGRLEDDNRSCLAALTNQIKEHKIQRRLWEQREADLQQEVSSLRAVETSLNLSNSELSQRARTLQTQLELIQSKASTAQRVSPDNQEVAKRLLASQDECEKLKEELCKALKSLDTERSKYHRKNEQHKGKLHRAKQKFGDETKWRDEKIKSLERELSLSVHSSAKEKQLLVAMNEENEKLLFEKRNLLKQLNEEEEMKNNCVLAASLSKRRVDFLEEENRKLEDRTLQLSNQLALLERKLRNVQSLHCAEELKKMSNPASVFLTSSPLQTSRTSLMMPGSPDMRGLLDMIPRSKSVQSEDTTSPLSILTMPLSRPAEMGYLNLTSPKSRSDCLAPSDSLSSTDSDEV